MRRLLFWGVVLVAVAIVAGAALLHGRGITARRTPFRGEARVARASWLYLVPAASRNAANPVPATAETLSHGLEHFADHCALCHANDGSGETTIGRNTFPRSPDLRSRRTQDLTDGELFYAIEQGVPWTAMPAWSNGTEEGARESWQLVAFIRHLPSLTREEMARMESLNPRSPADEQRDKDIDEFLRGSSAPKPVPRRHK